MSHKIVKQECLTRALRNSVKQGCPTRVSPQCVNSGCLTSEFAGDVTNKYCLCLSTYVSAFGFVGFILFFFNKMTTQPGKGYRIRRREQHPDGGEAVSTNWANTYQDQRFCVKKWIVMSIFSWLLCPFFHEHVSFGQSDWWFWRCCFYVPSIRVPNIGIAANLVSNGLNPTIESWLGDSIGSSRRVRLLFRRKFF